MLSKDDILHRLAMWNEVENRIRAFFHARGFLEVRTPILVASPGMEPNLSPFKVTVEIPGPPESTSSQVGLITSPEYSMKKLLGAGLERIFTITPVFRNHEPVNATHAPEFVLLEWYAPGGFEDLMKETEDLLQAVLEDSRPWTRIRHEEANVDKQGDPHPDSDRFFITHFPAKEAALAKLSHDGKWAERFEAYADGLELCNGFAELTDAEQQKKRFEIEQDERRALGKDVFPIDEELIEALARIETPVYGNALGIDRLVMLKYGIKDMRDIQLIHGFTP